MTIRARQVIVGADGVGDAHVGGVVVDFGAGAEGDDAEEHDFGQARGVLEGAGGFGFALGGVDPIQFVVFAGDAGELLRRFAEGVVERFGQKSRIEAVGVVQEFAFAAHEQRAAAFVEGFIA